jgi:hypothetical protein
MTQEIQHPDAQVFAVSIREKYGVELGCDRAGVEWLDRFIQSWAEALDSKTLAGLSQLVGSFLGECIIHEHGGKWVTADGREYVRIGAGETVDPFWMAGSSLRYRSTYSVSDLFAAVPAIAHVRVGGLYAARDENGAFRVYKVLAADHLGVHLRKYGNQFDECPSHLDPASLSIGLDFAAWQRRGAPASELPIGHLPLAHEGFLEMNPILVQVESVEVDELDGYHMWLTGSSPEEQAELSRPSGQKVVAKKWWQFWK